MRGYAFLAVITLGLQSCGELREPSPPRPAIAVTYQKQVRPLLESRCTSCHGTQRREGKYDLSSYVGLLGPGSDETPNALAGDERSVFLVKLDPAVDAKHWEYLLPQPGELASGEDPAQRRQADRELLRRWVVEDKLAYFDVLVHPPGWLYAPARGEPTFHGGFLRQRNWDFDACRGCHGEDLRGGSSGRSCETCHQGGPQGCTTCHGGRGSAAPPPDLSWSFGRAARGVGAHQVHLAGGRSWWAGAACSDCHLVPTSLRDAGHVDDKDLRAEVRFSGVAGGGSTSGYDATSLTCAGVYCHGGPLNDPTAQRVEPRWTATDVKLGCTSCHGMPGKGLGGPECNLCHQQSLSACTPGEAGCIGTGRRSLDGKDVGIRFLSPGLHIDGKAPLGRPGAGPCDACHGNGGQGAPPPGLHGETDVSAPAVGLHAAHLKDSPLSKAVACGECHRVPARVTDPGHVDTDLPAEVTFGPLARGQSYSPTIDTKPGYDRASGTCSNVYCHGLSGAGVAAWPWTRTVSPGCTSCHGAPPATLLKGGMHPPAAGLECRSCHAGAFTSAGQLDPAKHINGRVDL